MIFMGAAEIGDSASLDRAVKDDLNEIGKVGGGASMDSTSSSRCTVSRSRTVITSAP